ncbi:pyruvate dehydrogenase complex dihydrolipoyllysine-residue acetyltransferase [Chromohalobacter israelensis]|uniref:pyruvate dehydrogenase complex dihydrolipoyllysine-residue acetyltransferase n=1 Tax=Chromohalobacter israelensis TaxID=141390 RepID=UPI000FFEBF58|nr:pyruvate dehydrogenase complex dihydrolipoyllysine-residue acetyltransferase [Chromohalobacter salexigens]RXE47411.1 pyruvate dehydrogenase complex dihydrolipoyllysine-residue acetyltransferase [Chromohalobacter salexigens]
MSSEIIKVPDIGGSEGVEIIEVTVSEGDVIAPEDTMITLESDKASMDVPAPKGGKVVKVLVKEGDTVSEGDDILELEAEGGGDDAGDTASQDEEASQDESASEEQETAASEKAAPKKSGGGGKRTVEVKVPDIGGSEGVEIIEVPVSEGDEIEAEDTLITLESDKASMDVPSPYSGKLVSLAVKEGDSVSEGDVIGSMEIAGEGEDDDETDAAPAEDDASSAQAEDEADGDDSEEDAGEGESGRKELRVPDIGGSEGVEIIEVAIGEGDEIGEEDTLITLESDKASMDVPSPYKGKVVEVSVKEGDSVSEGDLIGYIEVAGTPVAGAKKPAKKSDGGKKSGAEKADAGQQKATDSRPAPAKSDAKRAAQPAGEPSPEARHKHGDKKTAGAHVHAGPAVRMLARELGVDLAQVTPTGPKRRVLKEDVQGYVKNALQQRASGTGSTAAPTDGAGIPAVPDIDFSQFGEVEEKPMGRLMKAGAANLHRSWLNVPHVTQFDEADITELEAFRKSMKDEAAKQDAKLTPLPFLIKACAYALQKFPQFNVSLKSDGETLVQKHYVHIGIAVDTPDGLMVPVIRNADQKSLIELAKESVELAGKAQSKKLKREEMTGGCFTISSLGSIGGTAFTPIVNAPEVAILGVSKAQMKPVWDGAEFAPRLMMPLSLSYDHRAVNGADAARFTAFLAQALSDIRRLLM